VGGFGPNRMKIQFTSQKGLKFKELKKTSQENEQTIFVARIPNSKTSLFINAISKKSDPGNDFFYSSEMDSVVYVAEGEISMKNNFTLDFFAKEYFAQGGGYNQITQVCHKNLLPDQNLYFVIDVSAPRVRRSKLNLADLLTLIQSIKIIEN
jgi:hypothetical protein